MIQYKIKELRQKSQAPKASVLGQPRGIGWGGRWEGLQDGGDTCIPVVSSCGIWQKPSQYCKAFILQLK